jgi:uncharacterized protein (UPF0262 family)
MSGRNLWCLFFLFIALFCYTDDYGSFYTAIRKNIGALCINEIEKRIAEKNYEKSIILARTDDEKLKAEIAFSQAMERYMSSSRNLHTQCFSSVFDVVISEIGFTISDLSMNIALLDYNYTKKLYELSGSTELNINEVFITYKQRELEQKQAEWESDEAKKLFSDFTGLEWKASCREILKEYKLIPVKEKEWAENDVRIKEAMLELKLAEYMLSTLPDTSSDYEKQLKNMEHEKAQAAYDNAVSESVSGFRAANRQHAYLANTLSLVKKNLTMYEDEIADAENRYKKKIIAEKDFLQKKYNYFVLQKEYFETLQSLTDSLITIIIGAGKNPEEVLK